MRTSSLATLVAALPTALAAYKGFNYGANDLSGAPKSVETWQGEFNSAKTLDGVLVPFTSARLYTSIQPGSANSPINAFEAAVNTGTSLLVGIWASAGSEQINNEIAAIQAAVAAHGQALTDLIAGISVGSEDVYRITPLGVASNAGTGADPATIAGYVSQVKSALNLGKPVGHVDTYNTWSNSSGWMGEVINVVDFVGMNAFPYYEDTKPNSIENANATFWGDYDATVGAVGGKPVWITETGWPTCKSMTPYLFVYVRYANTSKAGPTDGQAVPSVDNAENYYHSVGCHAFGSGINTWWYTLQDPEGGSVPSFGVVPGAGTPPPTTGKYNLHCS